MPNRPTIAIPEIIPGDLPSLERAIKALTQKSRQDDDLIRMLEVASPLSPYLRRGGDFIDADLEFKKGHLLHKQDGVADLDSATVGQVTAAIAAESHHEPPELLHVRDEKASGNAGGTFTSGAWRTRTLNTQVTNEITGASIDTGTSIMTLPAGTYEVLARAWGYYCQGHQARLQNVSEATTALLGSNAYSHNTGSGKGNDSLVRGRFTIASSKTFELQHRCAATRATDGWGSALSWGTEIYTDVLIWKLPWL